jgi:hypothetical protein
MLNSGSQSQIIHNISVRNIWHTYGIIEDQRKTLFRGCRFRFDVAARVLPGDLGFFLCRRLILIPPFVRTMNRHRCDLISTCSTICLVENSPIAKFLESLLEVYAPPENNPNCRRRKSASTKWKHEKWQGFACFTGEFCSLLDEIIFQ